MSEETEELATTYAVTITHDTINSSQRETFACAIHILFIEIKEWIFAVYLWKIHFSGKVTHYLFSMATDYKSENDKITQIVILHFFWRASGEWT